MKEQTELLRVLVSLQIMRFASELQAMHYKPPGPMQFTSETTGTIEPPEELERTEALKMAAEQVRREMPTVLRHLGIDE